jgi:hypothetical protein
MSYNLNRSLSGYYDLSYFGMLNYLMPYENDPASTKSIVYLYFLIKSNNSTQVVLWALIRSLY